MSSCEKLYSKKMKSFCFLYLIHILFSIGLTFASVCEISVSDKFKPLQPMFKVQGVDSLLRPNPDTGIITLKENESLEVCCPKICETQICVKDEIFKTFGGTEVDSTEEWICREKFEPEVISEDKQCLGRGTWLKSGIKYGGSKFMELYRVCYNFDQSTPLLVVHNFDKFHLNQQPNVDCPSTWFHRGYFDNIGNPNAKYTKSNAQSAIRSQLKDFDWANRISSTDSRSAHYLAKGHMAPKGDFVFAPEKLGSCSLINVVPQFQSINNGKWRRLESSLQKYIQNNPSHKLTIYTGAFGVLTINFIPLYLAPGNPNRIPIPKALYKIAFIQPLTKYVVFVAVNDFFSDRATIEDKSNGYKICRDICSNSDVKSIFDCDDKPTNPADNQKYIDSGYIYACDIDDFLQSLDEIYGIDLATELKLPKRRRPGN